ncbi:MAG: hypothetical protein SFZ03_01215 [Candidatus Melainabacteria bacterium]|nr:hypothetical protein [Candidatus Melainabacteria bacterium]
MTIERYAYAMGAPMQRFSGLPPAAAPSPAKSQVAAAQVGAGSTDCFVASSTRLSADYFSQPCLVTGDTPNAVTPTGGTPGRVNSSGANIETHIVQQPVPPQTPYNPFHLTPVQLPDGRWVAAMAALSPVLQEPSVQQLFAQDRSRSFIQNTVGNTIDDGVHRLGLEGHVARHFEPLGHQGRLWADRFSALPSLSQMTGIQQDMINARLVYQNPRLLWETIRGNFSAVGQASQYTRQLPLLSYIRHYPGEFMGRWLNAAFTRPLAETISSGKNIATGVLWALGLFTSAADIVISTAKAHNHAQQQEDGSWQSRLNTAWATGTTFASRTLRNGATWLMGTTGFVVGKALVPVVLAGGWPAILGGVLVGGVAALATGYGVDRLCDALSGLMGGQRAPGHSNDPATAVGQTHHLLQPR